MKKTFIVLIFFITSLALVACGGYTPNNNWVLEKDRLNEDSAIESFVKSLQESPDKKGFKRFTIAEDRRMVVVSTGDVEKSLELEDVKVESGNTKIILKEIENKNDEDNPYIMVGISAIKGELFVQDTDGNSYNEF